MAVGAEVCARHAPMLCVKRIMRVFDSRPEMSKSKWVRSLRKLDCSALGVSVGVGVAVGVGVGLGVGLGVGVGVGL